jgi:hypothetical protein
MAMTENKGGGRGALAVVVGLVLLAVALYFGSLQPKAEDEPPRPWHSVSP